MRQSLRRDLRCQPVACIGIGGLRPNLGQITGTVTDTSGAILVGASVTVTNTQTNAVREAQTNSAGSYVFPTLLPGIYNVKVDLQGFQSKVRNAVELQVQQTARLDFSPGPWIGRGGSRGDRQRADDQRHRRNRRDRH